VHRARDPGDPPEDGLVQLRVEGQLGGQVAALGLHLPPERGVAEVSVVRRVELDVVAPERDEVDHHVADVDADVHQEVLAAGIGLPGVLGVPEGPVVAGRGQAVLGPLPGVGLEESVLRPGEALPRLDALGHEGEGPARELRAAFAPLPLPPGPPREQAEAGQPAARGGDPAHPPHLAIGDDVEAGVLLQADGLQHGGVLRRRDLVGADLAVAGAPPRLQQRRRAQ
jgi:hypothetical protein